MSDVGWQLASWDLVQFLMVHEYFGRETLQDPRVSNTLLRCHSLLWVPLEAHLNTGINKKKSTYLDEVHKAHFFRLRIKDVFEALGPRLALLTFFFELWSVLIIKEKQFALAHSE